MLVSSRRSLILGLTSIVVAPTLVRATSLMQLRGENMDPWVWAYRSIYTGSDALHISGLNALPRKGLSIKQTATWIHYNSHLEYVKVRQSEIISYKLLPFVSEAPQKEMSNVLEHVGKPNELGRLL